MKRLCECHEIPPLSHDFDFLRSFNPVMVTCYHYFTFSIQLFHDWAGLTGDQGGRATKNGGRI